MGLFDIFNQKKQSDRLDKIAGQKPASFTSGQAQTTRPADYQTTSQRMDVDPAMYRQLQEQVDKGNISEEERRKRLNMVQVGPDGRQTMMATFEDPRYAGQAPLPSMRDQLAAKTTEALNATGIRNAENYQRTAPTVNVGLNASRVGQTIDQAGVNGSQLLGLQDRNSQADALSMQRMAALGQQPSVAAIQQQQGLDSAIAGQYALANSARGGAAQRGAAQNMATQQAGQMQQAAVGQAAALRAQEMAQARGAYGDLAGTMRAGDLGQGDLAGRMASEQARLYQEQQLGNQGVVADAAQTDAQLGGNLQIASMEGVGRQQVADDARALGLMSGTQTSDDLALQAKTAQEDARLRLLGLKSGIATGQEGRADRAVGGAVNTAGAVLKYFI